MVFLVFKNYKNCLFFREEKTQIVSVSKCSQSYYFIKYLTMLKNISNLGKALSKAEQHTINGGRRNCTTSGECGAGNCCSNGICWPIGTPGHLCSIDPIDDGGLTGGC